MTRKITLLFERALWALSIIQTTILYRTKNGFNHRAYVFLLPILGGKRPNVQCSHLP